MSIDEIKLQIEKELLEMEKSLVSLDGIDEELSMVYVRGSYNVSSCTKCGSDCCT